MPSLPRRALPSLLLPGLLMRPAPAQARIFTERGLALRGADTVAYFAEARPLPGLPEHAVEWGGARWIFASAANLARFRADPEAHAPAYGGFCAWAMARGYTAPIDPAAWRIVGGRLYLNYDRAIQRRWERDIPGHIARADENWPRLREG